MCVRETEREQKRDVNCDEGSKGPSVKHILLYLRQAYTNANTHTHNIQYFRYPVMITTLYGPLNLAPFISSDTCTHTHIHPI